MDLERILNFMINKLIDVKRRMNMTEKEFLKDSEYILNGNITEKEALVKLLESWTRETFIFRDGQIYLPHEKPLPVSNLDEALVKLENYKESSLESALGYLIMIMLSIGVKIGKEMAENDNEVLDGINGLSKEKKEFIINICNDFAEKNLTEEGKELYIKGVKDALNPSKLNSMRKKGVK